MNLDPGTIVTLVASIVGGGGLFTFLSALITRKQIKATSKKTDIDAASVLSTASLALLEPYQQQLNVLGEQLTRTQARANNVEEQLRVANNDLRDTRDLLVECNKSIADMRLQLNYYYDRYGPPTNEIRLFG